MVGKQNSTILTVSYGTFSCTLEGFDDSFGMMKAIAEYFRDLASDDRYFGAEPPTPDADMLAKIAEQEVSRRVEARTENGGVTLRPYQIEDAAPADDAPVKDEPHVEPVAKAATPAPRVFKPQEAFVEEADAFFGGDTSGAMLNEESVATRLKRIREAAKQNVEDAAELEADTAEDAILEDAILEDLIQEDDAEVETLMAGVSESTEVEDLPVTVAAEGVAAEVDFDEPEDDVSEDDIADLLAMDGSDLDEDQETPEEPSIAGDVDEELEALLGAIAAEADDDAEAVNDAETVNVYEDTNDLDDKTFEDDDEPEAEPIQARILHVKGAALQDLENLSEEDLIGFDDDAYEAPENEVDVDSLNAIFEDDDQQVAESSLSVEEEADLMRELAEAEAEDDEDGTWGALLDADTEAVIANEEQILTSSPETALANAQDLSSLLIDREADNEMGRLMAETETQLSEPEHTRRKTTIQHLKAAFAAKRADGDKIDDTKGNDSVAYREDLEQAVIPRRPVLGGPRKTPRLEAADAAPLKLVAEQRIVPDVNKSEPSLRPTLVTPVRPRRIRNSSAAVAESYHVEDDAVATAEVQAPPVDFKTYAEHMGVEKLPELLEAAAAYMTFVEEFEKFSRPQIMTIVRDVLGDDYTREDGLRAFGQLLREGKLIRLAGGRFTVSDGIGFQPN